MPHFLGIDVGTSGTKVLVTDARARILATATAEYKCSAPQPGFSEQQPDLWWRASGRAVRAALARAGIDGRQIAGIGLSGQMHGLVLTDGAGKPLRPAILWNDQRSAAQTAEITRTTGGPKKLIGLVGNVALDSFTLGKLLWVRRHQPRIYDRARHLLLPKDYVRLKLTGEFAGDVSDMSGTLMLDPKTRTWSEAIVSRFQIDRDLLPPVYESAEVVGTLRAAAARTLGLPAGVPVVAGGGDQPVGAVGSGVVVNGLTSAAIGTSGVAYVHSRQYRPDPNGRVQVFCSAVPKEYCLFGCVLAAGGSLQWFRNTLGQDAVAEAQKREVDPYDLLVAEARKAPPGCEGLFWLPYLTGERTPHTDPLARACWVGITARTRRAELIRSVMEGATFAMTDAIDALKQRGLRIRQIRLSGGGARSAMWRQMQADIYGTTCVTLNTSEGPAYGAALLAAVGAGQFASVGQACEAGIRIGRTIQPDRRTQRLYRKHYLQYRRLYPALAGEFARIAEL